jgi:glucose/mannose-6-phosphate isomerase
MGYQLPATAAAQFLVVILCSPLLPQRIGLRCAATGELLQRHGVAHRTVETWGTSPLAHLVAGVAYGDWMSYYLALLGGVDPTGIAAIEYLKARLAEAG